MQIGSERAGKPMKQQTHGEKRRKEWKKKRMKRKEWRMMKRRMMKELRMMRECDRLGSLGREWKKMTSWK